MQCNEAHSFAQKRQWSLLTIQLGLGAFSLSLSTELRCYVFLPQLEFRDRFPDAVKKETPDIGPMIRSAEVPPAPLPSAPHGAEPKLPQTAATLASGPLARGVRESGVLPAGVVTAQAPQRTTSSSSGNPFNDPVPPAPAPAVVPLQNLPSSRESSPQQQGPLARSFARSVSSAQSPGGPDSQTPAPAGVNGFWSIGSLGCLLVG